MEKNFSDNKVCCADDTAAGTTPSSSQFISIQPAMPDPVQDDVCCGSPPGPASSRLERPGYALCRFVLNFIDTPSGPVPRIKTDLDRNDRIGKMKVRWAINRNEYKVAPGLYCTGSPDHNAPVLVTANYKLTFDYVRKELD